MCCGESGGSGKFFGFVDILCELCMCRVVGRVLGGGIIFLGVG